MNANLKLLLACSATITAIIAVEGTTAAQAATPECRTAALPDGTPAMFCKDKKGNWKQQEGKITVASTASTSTASSTPLLYADANYRGSAFFQVPIKTRQRRPRNLADVIIAGTEPKTTKEEIFVSTMMRIDGTAISGTITGGSWTNNVPLTGTRKDGICNFSATNNGETVVYIGKCDQNGFSGQLTNYGSRLGTLKGEFRMDTISFTDTSVRDARKVELQKQCDEGRGSQAACVELEQM